MRPCAIIVVIALAATLAAAADQVNVDKCEHEFGAALTAAQTAQSVSGECDAFTALAKCLRSHLRSGMVVMHAVHRSSEFHVCCNTAVQTMGSLAGTTHVNEIITRAVARPTACDIQACKTSDLHDGCCISHHNRCNSYSASVPLGRPQCK